MVQIPLSFIVSIKQDSLQIELRTWFLSYLKKKYGVDIANEMQVKLLFLDAMLNVTLNAGQNSIIAFCKSLLMMNELITYDEAMHRNDIINRVLEAKLFKHEYLEELLVDVLQMRRTFDEQLIMIKTICHMFSLELGDWFHLYVAKKSKRLNKWLVKNINQLPVEALILLQDNYRALNGAVFNIKEEDLNIKHVIDSDYQFIDHMITTMTDDFYLNYSAMPNVMAWNSDKDYSCKNNLSLRSSKIIGYLDCSIDKVINATHYDSHLSYAFKQVEWHDFTPIQPNSSICKYPSALMTGVFDFGPLFSLRGVQFVFSSRSKKGNVTDNTFLFKSTDYVKGASNKDLISCPFIGGRTYNMVDTNRTRYTEVRTCNLGGFLNYKVIFTNPLSAKKLCMDNYNGILKALKEAEPNDYAVPDNSNYLFQILHNYNTHYHID